MFKFIVLSHLMSSNSLSGMGLFELRTQLRTSIGLDTISHCTNSQLPDKLQEKVGKKDPMAWLQWIVSNAHLLRGRNVGYFVLDTLEYLDRENLSKATHLLQQMSNSGIGVIAIDHHRTPIFFTAMREIVCTDAFMDIYARSMWQESLALKVKVRKRTTERQTRAPRVQFMTRIFVA